MKKSYALLTAGMAIALVSACGDNDGNETTENSESETSSEEILIGFNNYAESIAKAELFDRLLTEQGYDVSTSQVEKAFLFSGLENDEIDLGISAWLPFTDQQFLSFDSDNIDTHEEGLLYEGTEMGLVVPEYMTDIHTIEDLNNYVEELNGQIIGIDPGASLSAITEEEVLDHYGLDDFTLQTSAEQSMITALDTAYNNEEPIVVTLWSPHWTFGEYDLKYLDDPDQVYGEGDDIYYMTRPGLESEMPELIEFLNQIYFTDEQLSDLLVLQSELGNESAAVDQWMEDYSDVVDDWMNTES
ncbi:glycine betaine ABC transporter substrate-binding protein [Geomicrobium sediminis]|uniref:Glycine betaine/proline transport system substrate-binding protein n=1 Tax=Geomicrobium sediminis TaxID=1347788 RepID=A0ABS2PEJ4_9BACL|nr:glycine betaine ABC transporter substrate-binding protein [Geomicrobium sediminis]MBM7633238.1 glycine betaine/proline transport system substrate-binding protein [Geomicrobium sediminis]